MIRVYTIEESNVFQNQENYEIEIEVDNSRIGEWSNFNNHAKVTESLRKVIKYVLSGLQGTNYPVSYPEQKKVIDSYMKMIWDDEYDPKKFISSKNFIGPNSITLQLKNIAPIDDNSNEPNIRKDFVVTDKADGERHLMYISNEGKVYLINTNMDVIFTGSKTNNKECFNTLLDGELISHDKSGIFINLYAAFDVYFVKKQDVRNYTFMLMEKEDNIYKSRYQILKWFEASLRLLSITDSTRTDETTVTEIAYGSKRIISPIKFSAKEFFPNSSNQSIFDGCNAILQKEKDGRFEYTTDGLIFSHAFYGVGSNEIGKAGSKLKITWEHSFKWKPPEYNTIDFLITTVKGSNGSDIVKSHYEDGLNNMSSVQYSEYKTIELRCGFKESKDGFINPCQDIIDDKLPEFSIRYEDKQDNDYVPMRFYPTEPYDPNAGICNIMLRMDGAGGKKMFSEENEVFEDNTIVEFRYDLNKEEGWRWIPLRVRYDKTAKLRRGEKEYGNAYKVCNENWKSIHPSGRISDDMIRTGLNIPSITVSEDVYYNASAGKFKTNAMKNFHNLYVKKKLIVGASKQGDTLIDFACGKAGDLPKWISAKLSFVFGIDISQDNLENRLDGACARFLKMTKSTKNVPYALFVNGNSSYNIKDGSAMLNDKAKQITAAVFGHGQKDADKIGKGVARQYGKGIDGFNVSSCQFALHYFFETPDTLKRFMKNIAECTKHNGYFIGTCYDGKKVFNELKKIKTKDSVKIIEDGKKIWEIIKEYGGDTFDDDSSSIGYEINVYQESINQPISEYLVNFDYLNRVMSAYGFEIISQEEAREMGMPNGSGLFSELFLNMLDEISKNKFKAKDYDQAPNMSVNEQKISFLNRYFIYKKIRTVNTENVELELGEYQETYALKNKRDTEHAQEVAKNEVTKTAPKVRKLKNKLLLVAATEAIDEPTQNMNAEPEKLKKTTKKNKIVKPNTVKQKFTVVSSSDEED
jgi:SAM-dependent methyltransferase